MNLYILHRYPYEIIGVHDSLKSAEKEREENETEENLDEFYIDIVDFNVSSIESIIKLLRHFNNEDLYKIMCLIQTKIIPERRNLDVTSQIKTSKNGYKYLRIEKEGKSFCIFETEDYLILDIAEKVDSMPTLEDIQRELNNDTYNRFFHSYKNKHDLKDYYKRMSNINKIEHGISCHDKPDTHYIFNREIEEDTIFWH